MKLEVVRRFFADTYTIGDLLIDGIKFCDTLEDKCRQMYKDDTPGEIKDTKVYAETAIPYGTYKVTLDVISPKYSLVQFYKDSANGGRLPRLINVPGFEGILIHAGNTEKDTAGCILIGTNREKGKVLDSRDAFKKLYPMLEKNKNNLEIKITWKK